MSSTWKPLLLPHNHSEIPPLLIKCEFGPSDYKVWLTDLSHIWTESLDRRGIIRRALSVNTSIDPSEQDPTQMRLFLSSIANALHQHSGASLNLDESNDIKELTLNTLTPLPHPLQPLEWSIMLMIAPQSVFTSEFVLPLLDQRLTAKVEKTTLLQQLKEKDNVISKLIEKMQGDGIDLGKLFPGAVSSKSGTGPTARGAVAKYIKGLREFDQEQWERQLAKVRGISRDTSSLLPQIFDDDDGGKAAGETLQIADYGEWWKRVGRKDSQREAATPAFLDSNGRKESVIEDEFQRQSTPTTHSVQTSKRKRLVTETEPKISSRPGNYDLGEGDSTTDESNDDIQSSHSKPLPSHGDDTLASSPTNVTKGMHSELMDLSDDGLTGSASETEKSSAKTHVVPKPKQKLGKIGGKGKDSSPETTAISTSKPKLGKIGGKGKLGKSGVTGSVSSRDKGTASSKREDPVSPKQEVRDRIAGPKSTGPERKSRTVQQPPEPLPPRETSQERANRKREQLKRELENKSQAAIKKKRRF